MSTYGLGSITQRKNDGLWLATVYIEGKRHVLYAKTRDEAVECLHRLQAAKRGDHLPDRCGRTVTMLCDEYLSDIAPQNLRPKTLQCYSDTIRLHIKPYLGAIRLSNLTPQDLYKWLTSMQRAGASSRMRQLAHSVLNSVLKYALPDALNYISRNPMLGVKSPKVEHKTFGVWDALQTRHFLVVNQGHNLYPLFLIALTMGMRQGEILGLIWSDIDLVRGTIYVQKTLLELNGKVVGRVDVKSKRSRRVITMPTSLVELLRGMAGKPGSWVFSDQGRPFTKAEVVGAFEKATAASGLPRLRFHDLRHTSNTLLLSKNVHVKVMQGRAGHEDSSTTLNIYSHFLPAMDQAAADVMEGIVARLGDHPL